MLRRWWLIIVIIIIVALIAVYFLIGRKQPSEPRQENPDGTIVDNINKVIETESCDQTRDDLRDNCLRRVSINQAIQNNKVNDCLNIIDKYWRNYCVVQIALTQQNKEICSILEENDRLRCESFYLLTKALKTTDQKLCNDIPVESIKGSCLSEFGSNGVDQVDSDGDALYDDVEGKYGTDPKNPDTDADGYKDGEELINGYNPLGLGRLGE